MEFKNILVIFIL